MGLIVRQSLKSSVGFYLGVALGAANILYFSTNFLEAGQLAISRVLVENSLIFAAFAHLGTPYISDRFFHYFKNDAKQHHGILPFLLLLPTLGLTIFAITFWLFNGVYVDSIREKSPTAVPYMYLLLPLAVFWVYIMVLEAYSRANSRTAVPVFLREVGLRLVNILLVVVLAMGWINFDTFLYLMVGSHAFLVVFLFVYIAYLGKLYLRWEASFWNKNLIKEMTNFGLISILGGIGANLVLFLDRNFLMSGIGETATGVFIVASYIGTVIEIPSKSVRTISGPILAQAIKENNQPKIEEMYKKSALNLMLIGGFVFLIIAMNIDEIFGIMPKNETYSQGKWVVIMIAFAKWIDMSLGLNTELMAYSKYFVINTLLVLLMAAFAAGANYLLIPIYGLNGSGLATALTTLLWAISKLSFVYYKFNILPFGRKDLAALAVLVAVLLVGMILPSFQQNKIIMLLSAIYKSLIMSALFVFIVLKFRISDDLYYLYKNQVEPRLPIKNLF